MSRYYLEVQHKDEVEFKKFLKEVAPEYNTYTLNAPDNTVLGFATLTEDELLLFKLRFRKSISTKVRV